MGGDLGICLAFYSHISNTKTPLNNINSNKINMLTMVQFSKVLLGIDKVHTVPQRVLDCRPGLGGLNQVMGPTVPLSLFRVSMANISTSLPDVPQIGIRMISE